MIGSGHLGTPERFFHVFAFSASLILWQMAREGFRSICWFEEWTSRFDNGECRCLTSAASRLQIQWWPGHILILRFKLNSLLNMIINVFICKKRLINSWTVISVCRLFGASCLFFTWNWSFKVCEWSSRCSLSSSNTHSYLNDQTEYI